MSDPKDLNTNLKNISDQVTKYLDSLKTYIKINGIKELN